MSLPNNNASQPKSTNANKPFTHYTCPACKVANAVPSTPTRFSNIPELKRVYEQGDCNACGTTVTISIVRNGIREVVLS
ncbi:MAG: hypothetical protein AAF126_01950 [Chloroflexota bacterium]